jgi:hypothetical protein
MMSENDKTLIEQHLGTILQILVVALLGWSLSTTQTLTKDVEVLKVQMMSLTSTINQGTNDRYRGTDAAKDFAAVREEMARLERRVNKIEDKVLK